MEGQREGMLPASPLQGTISAKSFSKRKCTYCVKKVQWRYLEQVAGAVFCGCSEVSAILSKLFIGVYEASAAGYVMRFASRVVEGSMRWSASKGE
ncbi:hypothetical protein NPIL_86571 [Nephila pilipes]|uniref:Uncharacterized protein n=1 Tax=Nephila pilipes TaxID=299642 RepID=A0A8X6QMA8_NEPPI|nr:hypothetical protein NPIL_86571 [Nephila pilipes]